VKAVGRPARIDIRRDSSKGTVGDLLGERLAVSASTVGTYTSRTSDRRRQQRYLEYRPGAPQAGKVR